MRVAPRVVALWALLSCTALGCYGASTDSGSALTVDPGVLYGQMCSRCHGKDGKGEPEIKKLMPVRDFHDPAFMAKRSEEVELAIMSGRNLMPGFGGALSMLKIQHLAGYVRRLGRP